MASNGASDAAVGSTALAVACCGSAALAAAATYMITGSACKRKLGSYGFSDLKI